MAAIRKIPSPITILMMVIIIAALSSWLLPAGKYDTLTYQEDNTFILNKAGKQVQLPFTQKTLDSLKILIQLEKFSTGDIRKPVSVPGTYHPLPQKAQGFIEIIEAPLKGMYDTVDIIVFLLMIGGFINVFYSTGAMEDGLAYLSHKMKGRESWLIIILTFLFSFGGASFGMAEEGLAFYPIIVPLFIAAGYDLLVPVAVIFGGTQLGYISSFSNPFSTIIASNAAGISWADGLYGRLLIFVLSTAIFIWYILRYAQKVRKDPLQSLVLRYDGKVNSTFTAYANTTSSDSKPGITTKILLFIFLSTFLVMIAGVVFMHWWLLEMSVIFVVSAVLVAFIVKMDEKVFIEKFLKGAESMLGVSIIIAIARGVTIVLNDGNISDSIIFYAAKLVSYTPDSVFIVLLFLMFMVFTLFISSSSGMAVITMPIMGSLAIMIGVPGREIVNSYLFGMGIMGLITPTGLILPSLAIVNVSLKTWWNFIWPLMLMLIVMCILFLVVGIQL